MVWRQLTQSSRIRAWYSECYNKLAIQWVAYLVAAANATTWGCCCCYGMMSCILSSIQDIFEEWKTVRPTLLSYMHLPWGRSSSHLLLQIQTRHLLIDYFQSSSDILISFLNLECRPLCLAVCVHSIRVGVVASLLFAFLLRTYASESKFGQYHTRYPYD